MRIPSEIVRLIVEEVEDSQSLVALSQASKQLQIESERLLYRSLTEKDGTKAYKSLSSIKNCPRRAECVRVYHDHKIAHKQRRSMWNLIGKTLPLMINLRELAFRYIIGRPLTTIFPREYTPRLEKFIWSVQVRNFYGRESLSYVSQARKFLERQIQLRHLHWQPSPYAESNPKPSPHTLVPHLDTLIGDTETIRTYLPGRDSITTLQLFTGQGTRYLPRHLTFEETFDRLSSQLKKLKYLSIQPLSETFWDDRFLQLITPHLHSLETLRVLSLSELEINQELPKLKNLKQLIIINSLLANQLWKDINVELIFSSVPSLNFLYMGQEKIEGRNCESKFKKWARQSVLQGDMESAEEVLTHIAEV